MSSSTLNFDIWKLFLQAYPHQPELSHHFRITERHSDATQIPSLLNNLAFLNGNVLTIFCASGIDLEFSHLMSLTNIPTLAALVLRSPSFQWRRKMAFTQQQIRAWCRAASEKGALARLKVLFMYDCGEWDRDILRSLTAFPALTTLAITTLPPEPTKRLLSEGETYNGWCHMQPSRSLGAILTCEKDKSLSETIEELYNYVADTSSLLERKDFSDIRLSVLCTGTAQELWSERREWFTRNPNPTVIPSPRQQSAQSLREDSTRALKKRKVKHGKQQDVGSLLATFN